jgi:hypothetical protein
MREIYGNKRVQGELAHITLRFDGKLIYLKATKEDMKVHNEISALLGLMKSKGADLKFGDEWVEINLFENDKKLEYNGEILADDVELLEKTKVENVMCNIFIKILKQGQFKIVYRQELEKKTEGKNNDGRKTKENKRKEPN